MYIVQKHNFFLAKVLKVSFNYKKNVVGQALRDSRIEYIAAAGAYKYLAFLIL